MPVVGCVGRKKDIGKEFMLEALASILNAKAWLCVGVNANVE